MAETTKEVPSQSENQTTRAKEIENALTFFQQTLNKQAKTLTKLSRR
jgi:hypothetical protein